MSIALKGKEVAKALNENTKRDVQELKLKGITPKLAIVQVGERPEDISYRNGTIKRFNEVGMDVEVYSYDMDISMEDFTINLKKINEDNSIHGILIFRPLPKQLDYEIIKDIIAPEKDIDCMSPINLEKVFEGDLAGFVPCTPKSVLEILKHYNIPLQGANVVVINRSMVVGKPLAMMLLAENATVTICHSKTKNLPEIASKADIVIAAVGRARVVGEEYFNSNSVVIDVGINEAEEGKICGDVDYESVKDKVYAITPVPGGVGSVTSAILRSQVVLACKKSMSK